MHQRRKNLCKNVYVRIGGAAGDGIASVAESLSRVCSRHGLYVYAYSSYQSLIRGGHINMQLNISMDRVYDHGDDCNFLIALNQDTISRHADLIMSDGAVIYNNEKMNLDSVSFSKDNVNDFGIPSKKIASKYGSKPILQNIVALGCISYLLGLPSESVANVLQSTFQKKGDEVVQMNISVMQCAFEHARESFGEPFYRWNFSSNKCMFMTGNQAIGLGALSAGCKFYSAYPMTPSSGVLHYLAENGQHYGMVVKQCEDEIASINMIVGSGNAGVRSMTATSGGGFSLMTEGVGLASMLEVPIVVMTAQRGGPSTGLPTKTEQADLFQVLGASQGDYQKIVIASSTVESAFYDTVEAFNLADMYQCPVFIMSDLLLSEHYETIEDLDFSRVSIQRGKIQTEVPSGGYKRYLDTEDGISPRAFPGTPGLMFIAASDEHDEDGNVISDVFTDPIKRKKMVEKRMKKMETFLKNFPCSPVIEGNESADLTVITWGSTYGVVKNVIQQLNNSSFSINHLNIKYLWPFKSDTVSEILRNANKTLIVEGNYSGQLERLIRQETGISIHHHLRKYDGEPFGPAMIKEEIEELLK